MAMPEYIPQIINIEEKQNTRAVVTAQHWNELFNLLISQGNNSAKGLAEIISAITAPTAAGNIGAKPITGVTGTNVQAILEGLKALIDLCYTKEAVDSFLAQKEDLAAANNLIKTATFNKNTGVFTTTTQGGVVTNIDLGTGRVAVNFDYDPETQSLVLTLPDGSTTNVSLDSFIAENDFINSDTVDFIVDEQKITAVIKDGSITDAKLSSALATALLNYKNSAETSATNAASSEANALTYSQTATEAANSANVSKANSKTSETNAKTSEINSKTSETNAANSAAEAKSYRDEASSIVGTKVATFNGRDGVVVPQAGDYTADMVGAATHVRGTATLDVASWVGTAAPYTYELVATGVIAGDTPHVDRITGTDAAAAKLINEAWALLMGCDIKPQVDTGKITFYATDKPTTSIPVMWEVTK